MSKCKVFSSLKSSVYNCFSHHLSNMQNKSILYNTTTSSFKPHLSSPLTVTGTRWFRGTLYGNWLILERNKISQRLRRKGPFRPAMPPFAEIYDPEHYITVKPPPPLKDFINIRNCKVKESWQSFGLHTARSSTSAIINVKLLSLTTPVIVLYCVLWNDKWHGYLYVK